MRRLNKKLISLLSVVLLLLSSVSVLAYTYIDSEHRSSLTIDLAHNEVVIPDAKFELYYLADINLSGHYELSEAFSEYPIDVTDQTVSGWKDLSQLLKGYVAADDIQPDLTGTTGYDGKLVFEDLKQGLYFVAGPKIEFESYIYEIEPTIVSVPDLFEDEWIYDVTIKPKSTREDPLTEVKVIKAWSDEGSEKNRPQEITIDLMMDREIYDSVALNNENGWTHIFEELPEYNEERQPIDWSVVERDVKNYSVVIDRNENVFVITNTYNRPPHGNDVPELPNTGQLQWPIPVMAFSGLCLIALGTLVSRKKNY